MSEEITKPEGKGMGVAGFVIALVGLIFSSVVLLATAGMMATGGGKGLAYFWLILCIASVVLSAMGMMKLGKTGGKKGLAIAGLVIGIVATIWTGLGLTGLSAVESEVLDGMEQLEGLEGFEDLEGLEDLLNN